MTQTLSPNDTGEIQINTDRGMATQNLAPYAEGLPPAFRRPGATGEQPILLRRPAANVQALIDAIQAQPVTFRGEHNANHRGRHRLTLGKRLRRLMGGAR